MDAFQKHIGGYQCPFPGKINYSGIITNAFNSGLLFKFDLFGQMVYRKPNSPKDSYIGFFCCFQTYIYNPTPIGLLLH